MGAPINAWVLSCLQEISRNVDTLALAPPRCPPVLREGTVGKCILQAKYHEGSKSVSSNGGKRMDAFCEWIFSKISPAASSRTVVCAGHSLWFRTFFRAYLPHDSQHECKIDKIVNCGVVSFE